jgi:hypothetical protein
MIPDPHPQLRSPASLPARIAAVVIGLALALAAGAPQPASARTDGSSGTAAGAPPAGCSGVPDLVLTAARVPAGARAGGQRPSKVAVVPERLDQAAPGRSTGVALAAGGLLVLSVSAVAVLAERARRGDRGTGAGAGRTAKRRRRSPRRRRP